MNKIKLYEFGDWMEVKDPALVKRILQNAQNTFTELYDQELADESETNATSFLQFDGSSIRARNYVGFVQTPHELIEIYPKIFADRDFTSPQMLEHIIHWLSRCSRWRYPFLENQLGLDIAQSFPQLILYLMARQINELVSSEPLMLYQAREEALTIPRGRIAFDRYVSQSLRYGKFHILECDHEPFLYDNLVNRIIKYCVRLIGDLATPPETQELVRETLFILDEVEDSPVNPRDFDKVVLNNHFRKYTDVLMTCKMLLDQKVTAPETYDLDQWCLLIPMELVYEDYVAHVCKIALGDSYRLKPQSSDLYLALDQENRKIFQMRHDILLTPKEGDGKPLIIDTKYKLRGPEIYLDSKRGVNQADMYQMLSYAFRRDSDHVFLFYPSLAEDELTQYKFQIPNAHANLKAIHVSAVDIPFTSNAGPAVAEDALIKKLRSLFGRRKYA